MKKRALIIFVKNPVLGTVKTRLAADIGDERALDVHKKLMRITEAATTGLTDIDVLVYFSDTTDSRYWPDQQQFVQTSGNLGERMESAFAAAFQKQGYQKVVGIGSDLPDLSEGIIIDAFNTLSTYDTVFGPAQDGGYYIYGMNAFRNFIFRNKPWSTERLLAVTLRELDIHNISHRLLPERNDVDTLDDLMQFPDIDLYTT